MTANFCTSAGAGGPSSGRVVAQAERSLALLSAIENTVYHVTNNAVILGMIASEFCSLAAEMPRVSKETAFDPEGRASDLMARAANAAQRIYDWARAKRAAAQADKRLTGDDGVEDAYTEMIRAAADVLNSAERCRDIMETCDALHSPRGDRLYTNAEELFADIRAGR